MRPSARLRRLFERIARLFRRAVLPVPPRVDVSALRRAAGAPRVGFDELLDEESPCAPADISGLHDASLFGDFADQEEAQRFAGLPPIGAEALEGVDWDELARELTGPR